MAPEGNLGSCGLHPEFTLVASGPVYIYGIGSHSQGSAAPGEGKVCFCVPSRPVRRLSRRPDHIPTCKILLLFCRMQLREFAWQKSKEDLVGKQDTSKSHRQKLRQLRGKESQVCAVASL